MAKRQQPSNDSDIKKLLDGLYKIVQTTNSTSKEQVRINKELLKTMAVLQSGFAKNEEDARKLIDDVRDGLELNDDYAKRWLKKMGATEKQIDEIIDKFRDLEKVDMDLIDNAEDYLELLEKRYDILDDTFDLTKRLLTNHDAITKAIRASKDTAMKLAGPMGDVDTILQRMVAKKVDVSAMFDGMNTDRVTDTIESINDDIAGLINNVGGSIIDLQLNFSPLTDDLDKEIKDVLQSIEVEKQARLAGLVEYFDVNKKLQNQLSRSLAASMSGIDVKFDVDTGQISTASGILDRSSDEYQAMIQKLDEIADKNNITDKLKVDFKKIAELISIGVDRTEDQNIALKQLLQPLDLATRMMVDQLEQLDTQSKLSAAELMQAKTRYELMGGYLNQLQTAESIVLKIGSGFDNLNAIMPTGIGEFLGLSKVSAQLIESHKKGVQAFAKELEGGVSHADALKSYYQELTPALSSALNPMTILVTSTILLFKFVSNIVDKYKDLSNQLNVSLGQSKKLYDTQLDILTSQKNQFATMEDITDAQRAMIGTSGKVFDLTDKAAKELMMSLVETGKVFGYGTEQAVKLHKVFNAIGADDRLAENLQQNLGLLSEAAGISPQIVSNDLIDSAEEVSLYFAGMPQQAAKAAIRVRQLGMSLKQAGQIAQKMLNLEGFMTDMYELQAMTGGGIDFSRAFDKGLVGDIEGMTEEIMNNIGTTAEYNRMDYLTRMKIANTLGISVDELAKSVKLHEDMQGMSEKDQKYLQANLDRMGDISAASKEEIRNRMQQLQSTDRLNVAWEKIKGTLIKALLPAVEIIADAISAISPILDGIVGIMKIFGGILKVIFPIVRGLLFPFKIIGSILEQITSVADSFGDSLSGVNKILSGIGDVAYGVGAVIGTIFAVRNIGTFFTFISGGFGSILKSVTSIVPALLGTFGNIFQVLTGISIKSSTAVSTTAQSVAEQANSSIQSTKDVAKQAVSEISGVSNAAVQQVQTAAQASTQSVVAMADTISTDPIKSASMEIITNVETASKKSIKSVQAASVEASAAIDKVKSKSKSGFFKSDASKTMFKAIGTIGAATFASLGTQLAASYFKGEEAGKDSVENVSASVIPLFGTAFGALGPMLFESLSHGVEKFIRKQLEGKLEKKFDPVLKKVRKGFGSLESPITKTFEKAGKTGKNVFGKMFDSVKKIAPKPFAAVSSALTKVTSKFGKSGGIFGKIFGTIPEIPVDAVEKSTESISGSIDQVKQALPEMEQVQKSVVKKEIVVESPEEIKQPKSESIDTKPIEEKTKSSQRSIKKSFESIGENIKSLWESVKASIKDIVAFGIDVVKQIATGIVDVSKILVNGLKSISTTIFDILKSMSKSIKSILTDIVNFASQSMKTLSSGIGQSIKNIFKGIGDGLSSFKTSALKGAATLIVLSGALWVTSKAFQNFAKVDWNDIAKGTIAIAGLSGIAMLLGNASVQMILGSVAIAALGAALIPTAIAMEKFNLIDWSSLAKAGTAIVGFAAVATLFGTIAPVIVVGSLAIGAASVSIMVFAGSISMLSESILTIDSTPLQILTKSITDLSIISVTQLFAISGAITTLSASMLAFSSMKLGSGIIGSISGIFANDLLNDLEKFASLANPLQVAANAIGSLSSNLSELAAVMNQVDLTKLDDLKNAGNISVEQEMTKRIQGQISDIESVPRESTEVKMVPIPVPQPKVQLPRKESVAQNVKIVDNPRMMMSEPGVRNIAAMPSVAPISGQKNNNIDQPDIYNRPELPLKELKFLLQDAVKYLEIISKKNTNITLDSYKVGKAIKTHTNNT